MRLPRRPPRAPRLAPSPRPRFTERQGRRRGCGKRVLPAVLIPSAPSTRPGGESLGPGRRLPGHPGSSRPSAFKSLECAAPHPAPTTITTARRQRKAKLNPEAAAQRRQTASAGRRESRRGRGDTGTRAPRARLAGRGPEQPLWAPGSSSDGGNDSGCRSSRRARGHRVGETAAHVSTAASFTAGARRRPTCPCTGDRVTRTRRGHSGMALGLQIKEILAFVTRE